MRIIRNSLHCNHCETGIESRHRWDYVTCKCGKNSVDGGKEYLKRTGKANDYYDTSIVEGELDIKVLRKPKILFWDIETSLSIVSTFSILPHYINPANILQDWNIICGSWKWQGDSKVYSVAIKPDREARNDYEVVKKISEIISEADVIVHHNGDKFDIKKLNARLIFHKLPPIPIKLTTIDTCKAARKHMGFSSNKLDYIAKHLGCGEKMHTSADLWRRTLAGDDDAINEMVEYNRQDVVILEKVYERMRPYISLPNIAAFAENEAIDCCKNCQSENITYRGFLGNSLGTKRRFVCDDCGKWDHLPSYHFRTQHSNV